jgi:hypothetical protein
MKQLQDKYDELNTMEDYSTPDLLNVNKAKLLQKEK